MRWLIIAVLLGCVPARSSSSVALPHCRGVWVAESLYVTAAHCVGEGAAVRVHDAVDLALVRAEGSEPHSVAELATGAVSGDVTIVSSTTHRGQVIAERLATMPSGAVARTIQVAVSAGQGDSGSGAFDMDGRLVGVCSFARDGDVFFVHARHVAELMEGVR